MEASEITSFSRNRKVSTTPPPVVTEEEDAPSNGDVPAMPPELQFGSQLSAFQSMEANDDEVLSIIRSVGPSERDAPTMNSLAHMETWASFQSFGPRCQRCGNPCGDDVVYFESLAFHKRHFTCRRCNQPLIQPVLLGGDLFCSSCAQNESAVRPSDQGCVVCHAPYGQDSIIVAGRCFCKQHFRCATCHQLLTVDSYRQRMGHIYCLEHAPNHQLVICAECNGEITEKSVVAIGQKFHPQCFCCQMCKENLSNKAFAAWKAKPVCQVCFKKLPKHIRVSISKQSMRGGI